MKGFTLIEVLIAMAMLTVGAIATTKLVVNVVGSSHTGEVRMKTTVAAQGILDRQVALMLAGNPVPAPVIAQPYVPGNADILYDLYTRVIRTFPGTIPAREVFLRVTAYQPILNADTSKPVAAATVETLVIAE